VAFQSKVLKKIARGVLASTLAIAVLITVLAIGLNTVRCRDAQRLLNVVRAINVGETTGSEVLRVVRQFDVRAYVIKETQSGSANSIQAVDVSPTDCVSASCTLWFASDAHAGWMRAVSYPLFKWPALRRWLPISGLGANVIVEHGTVSEVFVELESVQQDEVHRARTSLTSKPGPAWNIKRYTAFNTGGPGRTSPTVATVLNPKWPHRNADAALDFNVRCLRIGQSCSECEILPRICEDDDHGQWFYFEMSGDLLNNFRAAVNELPMGSSEDILKHRIGGDRLTSKNLYDDKLPYRFPDGTVFLGDTSPLSVIYYVKKWRDRNENNPQDQKVTFVFDEEDRLVQIISQADGIRNRP
jgi:hypothetical protein